MTKQDKRPSREKIQSFNARMQKKRLSSAPKLEATLWAIARDLPSGKQAYYTGANMGGVAKSASAVKNAALWQTEDAAQAALTGLVSPHPFKLVTLNVKVLQA